MVNKLFNIKFTNGSNVIQYTIEWKSSPYSILLLRSYFSPILNVVLAAISFLLMPLTLGRPHNDRTTVVFLRRQIQLQTQQ